MNIEKDDVLQRKLALHAFMSAKKPFQEELDNQIQYAEAQVDLTGYVGSDDLCKLNYDLGVKAGLNTVLNILQRFEEEIAEPGVKGSDVQE